MFDPKVYEIVKRAVTDPRQEECNFDARAWYGLRIFDEAYGRRPGADDVDAVNMIDDMVLDRLIEIGRRDDWTEGEVANRDFGAYEYLGDAAYVLDVDDRRCSIVWDFWHREWRAVDREGDQVVWEGRGDTPQHALDAKRMVIPVTKRKFYVDFRQVVTTARVITARDEQEAVEIARGMIDDEGYWNDIVESMTEDCNNWCSSECDVFTLTETNANERADNE